MSSAKFVCIWGACAFLLMACSDSSDEDLQSWMLEQRNNLKPMSEPVLAPKKFNPQIYSQEGKVEPFGSQKLVAGLRSDYSNPVSYTHLDVYKRQVQDRQGLAEAAGLRPIVVDIEPYASRAAAARLIQTLPGGGRDSLVALFEIGAVATSMQVICNGDALYERDQAFGGAQLSQMIARQYGFALDEAELKKRTADLPEDYANAVLNPFVGSMAQEISRALQFFFTSTPHNRVDHILLAGGTAGIAGLTEEVRTQTSFACMVVNPFEGMELSLIHI